MVGTLPRTALLLTNSGVVQGHFQSWSQIGHHFGIKVSDDGVVNFNGEDQNPRYIMHERECMIMNTHWKSKEDVIRDWCSRHMRLPSGYSIYRYLC